MSGKWARKEHDWKQGDRWEAVAVIQARDNGA